MKPVKENLPAGNGRAVQPAIIRVEISSGREQAALKAQLTELAKEIASLLSNLGPVQSREIADSFVSELLLSLTEKDRLRTRRQKQAAGIAVAKARGVHFGPQPQELPDNFEKLRLAWRSGQMTLREAAEACGIPKSTFHDAALRVETSR